MDARRPPIWWELPIVLLGFLACALLPRATFGRDKVALAREHAHQVLSVQRSVGLDVETAANRWLAGQDLLATIVGYHYATVYVLTSIAILVYLYLRRVALYRWARRSMLLLNLLAALCFALYPVAPPRLNPDLSIVDVVQRQHIWGTWGSPVGDAANQLAALPSLHFAWVLWVLVLLVIATRSIVLIVFASLDVAVTAVTVVATGNHYPLDLVAGAVVVAVSLPATCPWGDEWHDWLVVRLGRPGRWLRSKAILA